MIKIVTVYQTLNPGSYLQSFALFSVIKEKYGDVMFYNTHTRNTLLQGLRSSVKLILKLEFSLALKQMIMAFEYKCNTNKLPQSPEYSRDDVVILGSDEIWNVSRKDMSNYPIFWGDKLNQNKCIAYAPSINNASEVDLKKHPFVESALKHIYKIGVRDNHSRKELKKLVDREIELVCDPTMLILPEQYRKQYRNIHNGDKYIFVYGPDAHFDKRSINSIINYAKANGYKLYSYYYYHKWVDKEFYGDPYCFLELLDNASYVFTSTFHGTIFSIVYNKQFFAFGNNKKVSELLEQFNLQTRKYKENNLEISTKKTIDYNVVNNTLSNIASKSKDYLYKSIEEIYFK